MNVINLDLFLTSSTSKSKVNIKNNFALKITCDRCENSFDKPNPPSVLFTSPNLTKFPDAPLPMAYKREAPPTLGKRLTVQKYMGIETD